MIQQINLYLPELRSKKDPLTAKLIAQIVGGVAAVMFLISAYDVLHRVQLNLELSGLNSDLAEERARTEDLNRELASRSQDGDLSRRLEIAEARLESRRQIRNFLNESQLGNVIGFSEYYKDLSRAAMEGLSITNFSFSNGGETVAIAGNVLESALVPRFVTNLQHGQSPLRTKHFNPSISRADLTSQAFSYSLSSTR